MKRASARAAGAAERAGARRPARRTASRLLGAVIAASTPLDALTDQQHGQPQYLALAPRDRALVRAILATARRVAAAHPSCNLLPVEGGWSAVVRVPATRSEETLVLGLLSRERVLVHPGYFFDFEHEAFLVVSLLVPEAEFADAFARTLRFAEAA